MSTDYDSILTATDSNVINKSEYYVTGKDLRSDTVPMSERPYMLSRDNNIVSVFILMFVIISLSIYHNRLLIAFRIKKFFTTRRIYSDDNVNDNSNDIVTIFLLCGVCSCSQSILLYHCLSHIYVFPSYYDRPYWIIGAGMLLFLLLMSFRGLLYFLVNKVFFDNERQRVWNNSFILSTILSSYAFFILSALTVFLHFSVKNVIIYSLFVLFLFELLLLYKLIVNFTNKKSGILLIILYFCSVEIMPYALLWHFINWIFNSNLVNNLLT